MSWLLRIGWSRGGPGVAVAAVLALAALWLCTQVQGVEPEIALVIGESYDAMRERSSAAIEPAIPGHAWYNIPQSDARLRFIDPQYGFVTPQSRFFTVSFDNERVDSVRMSPQIEPLPLEDALKIVLDLQTQWRKHGWTSVGAGDDPPFADTLEWRKSLQNCEPNASFWQAAKKYQVQLNLACFEDDKHPGEARYLITLEVSKPYLEP